MLGVLARLAEIEAGGIDSVGNMVHLIPPDLVYGTACGQIVDDMAVSAGDDGGVVGGFCTALDLDAVHTGIGKLLQVVDHAHIPGVQDVSALFVLEHGEVFPGTLFFHQGVLVAAGLGAGAPVGVPAGHVVAEQATAGVADAHGTVTEGLDLQLRGGLAADLRYFRKAALSGQDYPLGTQIKPGLGAFVVGDGLLGRDVPLALGGVLARQGEGTQVCQDQGVHTGVVQPLQVGRQVHHLMVPGHGVDGHMDLDPVAVGKFHSLGQLLRGEVSGEGAHAEVSARQVYRIRAIEDCHAQPLHVTGRTQ